MAGKRDLEIRPASRSACDRGGPADLRARDVGTGEERCARFHRVRRIESEQFRQPIDVGRLRLLQLCPRVRRMLGRAVEEDGSRDGKELLLVFEHVPGVLVAMGLSPALIERQHVGVLETLRHDLRMIGVQELVQQNRSGLVAR
jgi:hypothetical protein